MRMSVGVKNLSGIFLLLFLSAVFFYSCEKTDEGPSTGESDRDKFLGAWQGSSTGSQPPLNFNMNVTAGASSASQILMANFDAYGSSVKVIANVSGNDVSIIGVPNNIIGSDTLDGTGTYNTGSNTITFHYTVRDGQTVDNRTANVHR